MTIQEFKDIKLPGEPGVYLFKRGATVLYVGKATSLRSRVRSYFSSDLGYTRGAHIVNMVGEATTIGYVKTDSVLEALILEAQMIKKLQPPYNTKDKDDKSFLYVTITRDPFPRILLTRGAGTYGPFPGAQSLRAAYELIRKLFPFNTHNPTPDPSPKERGVLRPCFDYELGVCPGTCIGKVTRTEYMKTVRNIKLFFEGKKQKVIKLLEREMAEFSKAQDFEKAGEKKRQIFSLQHIHDISLIKTDIDTSDFRIEAYDVAHLSGKNSVGVMVVIENGIAKKSGYRKFKIKKLAEGSVPARQRLKLQAMSGGNDIANLKEVLTRRLGHDEWPLPDLIVTDGGYPQKNTAEEVLEQKGFTIPVVSVVKDERHKPREILGEKKNILGKSDAILLANSESHRFAIAYHKLLRKKKFLP
ncbi:MAG: UvrB/UvrC motif-containing protein [Candidatus Paceibacterota bacterium]|jgi:excinuclease ABC subunit C